jgi:sterol desaturase/sphingolipid hydroxylase (fatty acid hydroxylase superfamily)
MFPAVVALGALATHAGLMWGGSAEVVTVVVTVLSIVAVGLLERARPERVAFRTPDQPLRVEIGHFLLGVEVGSTLGLLAAQALGLVIARALAAGPDPPGAVLWPTHWPLAAQILVALALGDLGSYVQHRAMHVFGRLWPFHAVHHALGRLSLLKAGTFSPVDIAALTIFTYLPLVALGASEVILTWVTTMAVVTGLLQHANLRQRTPRWLDAVVCTPAVHWQHHARARATSEGNYAVTFSAIDRVFGTYLAPEPRATVEIGAEGESPPVGLWAQIVEPFRRSFGSKRP